MKVQKPAQSIFISVLIVIIFVLSLFAMLQNPSQLERVLIFFPAQVKNELYPESRAIPLKLTPENRIRYLMQAIIAGPQNLTLLRIVPQELRVKQVFFRKSTVYISLDASAQAPDDLVVNNIRKRLYLLQKSVLYNTSGLAKVIFIINNREVSLSSRS